MLTYVSFCLHVKIASRFVSYHMLWPNLTECSLGRTLSSPMADKTRSIQSSHQPLGLVPKRISSVHQSDSSVQTGLWLVPFHCSCVSAWNPMARPSPKWWSTTTDRSDLTVPSPIPSTHLGIWACGSTWRRHTGKHGSSAPHERITQPTSWPHVASPTWSSTEQLARPATKRFHTSDWRALEACCRPWTWWCNDATDLAGYATMMMMMMMIIMFHCYCVSVASSIRVH